MKRLYYLTGNLDSTEQISNDMHQAGITDWHFHVVSKDEAGLYRRNIHAANLIQKHDVIRSGERGAMIGGVVGLLLTAFLMATEPFGPDVSGFVYVAAFGCVTLFGAWVGGLAGLATENHAIAQFHDDIHAGKYLIMIDVRRNQEERVRSLMAEKHPEAKLMRVGSTFVNPFEFVKAKPA
ncbi:hypothetical protein [Methylocaldum szegediense]|jgi:hypothetical protein|uniref:Transmembrane protein n=1 Tax=Methylocaldum szegediense TaxID=73780 RepID=A0ABM9HWR0_9GAMM|nr:hypothetical protein [Methylocaldum szegediense]CAI8736424.1 conserved protein of unknown function [Methylocaldum szegediense]